MPVGGKAAVAKDKARTGINNPCQKRVCAAVRAFIGRRPNGFLGLSLNDRTILFLITPDSGYMEGVF